MTRAMRGVDPAKLAALAHLSQRVAPSQAASEPHVLGHHRYPYSGQVSCSPER